MSKKKKMEKKDKRCTIKRRCNGERDLRSHREKGETRVQNIVWIMTGERDERERGRCPLIGRNGYR